MWTEFAQSYGIQIGGALLTLLAAFFMQQAAIMRAKAETQSELAETTLEREQLKNQYERFQLEIMKDLQQERAKQAEDLVRYTRENGELRLEMERSKNRTELLTKQLDDYQKAYDRDMKLKDEQHEELKREIKQLRERLDAMQRELNSERAARKKIEQERDAIEQRAKLLEEQNAALSRENTRLTEEMKAMRAQLDALQDQINKLQEGNQ